jgi:membrane fusion protein (multidrug efflux system)
MFTKSFQPVSRLSSRWAVPRVAASWVITALFGGFSLGALDIPGITEPSSDATLTTPVAGVISRILHLEGDAVAKGDVVVQLDNRLEELEVQRRTIALENATAVLRRTEQLAATSKAVSAEELDKQRAEMRIAQAELDFAREQLRRRQITAPFAGVIADLFGLDPGEGCQPQTPVVRLVDTRHCLYVADVEGRVAQRLKVGQKFPLFLETATGTQSVEAELKFVSPVAHPGSGLVKVKAVFDNGQTRVAAGATAVARLPE